ncbi:MAG TPA: phospholipase, partial [Hyphomicrobiales bacterium]|nr:phospholipase [Hyphomicrobiales bacterium]
MNTDPRARDGRLQEAEAGGGGPILRPGRNCWRIATARRASLLVDADAYFLRLEQALQRARRSILILGWDFDASIRLRPDGEDASPPLGDLLRGLVEQHPELHVRVLVWSLSTLHAPGASLPLLLGAPWQEHPRIDLRMDRRHPLYAAHHQKIVCIDDAVAFVGGMDLTVARWDTSRHKAEDPRRVNPDGSTYGPVHDLQTIVDGQAAQMVAEVARQRWRGATGEDIPPAPDAEAAWPEDLEPDFTETDIAVARTEPGYGGKEPVHETAALTTDALKAAKRFIYIEAQYLTARRVRSTLLDVLSEKDGPEVVVMMTRSPNGVLEWYFMSANRDRLVRRL